MLARTLRHPAFLAGELDTHFLERHPEVVSAPVDVAVVDRAAIAATLWQHEAGRRAPRALPQVEPGWRNVWHTPERVTWRSGEHAITLAYRNLGDGALRVTVADTVHELRVLSADARGVRWQDGNVARAARVIPVAGGVHVAGEGWSVNLALEPRFPDRKAEVAPGSLVAPMPGKVVKVLVGVGDAVEPGTTLLILEAMKMELPVKAPVAGKVASLAVVVGEQVEADQLLAVVSAPSG
jgi:propionyl-CoA carboxylase alpha chain